MDVNPAAESGDRTRQERQQAQQEETQKMVEALRTCLQTSLVGESQNFRSSVAAAYRNLHRQQRLALALTALACVLSALVMWVSVWERRQVLRQTEARFEALQKQAAAPDPFADLRRANWAPVGRTITQNGRTFIELKPAK
jgi:hypothetical protein